MTEHAYTTLPAAGTLEGIPEVSTTCPAPFYAGIPSGTLWHSWLALFFFAFLSGNLCSWKVVEWIPRLSVDEWLSFERLMDYKLKFSSVQPLSFVWLFVTLWTVAHQAFLSITNSQSLLKLMSIESVTPSIHPIFCHPLLLLPAIFPSSRAFSNESVLHIRWPKYWSFNFSSVLPMNIQDWVPLGLTGWISLQSKWLSRVFSNTTVQKRRIKVIIFFLESSLSENGFCSFPGSSC